jgi:hypothetical protein
VRNCAEDEGGPLGAGLQENSSPLIANIVDQINNAADKRVDHVFWRLVQLFLIIAVLVMIIVVVHNRLKGWELNQTNQ